MSAAYFQTPPSTASGSVTSINASGGTTGLTFSGGPITTSGTLTLSGVLLGANGGTGVANTGKTITVGGNFSTDGVLALTTGGSATSFLNAAGGYTTPAGGVTGPGTTTVNRIALWNSTTGAVLKDGDVGTNASAGVSLVGGNITDTTSRPITFSQTWNNAGGTFTGFTVIITDTASNAVSVPFAVNVNASNVLTIRKNGAVYGATGTAAAPNYASIATGTTGVWTGTTDTGFAVGGSARLTNTSTTTTITNLVAIQGALNTITNSNNGETSIVSTNNNGGTGAFVRYSANNGTNGMDMGILGTAFTTSGGFVQGSGFLICYAAAGMSIIQNNAAGPIRFYSGGIANERMRLHASGGFSIGNTTDPGAGNLSVTGTARTQGYTVATLPAGVVGARAYVTDALTPAYGVALTGGGAVVIPAFYNGTAWIAA